MNTNSKFFTSFSEASKFARQCAQSKGTAVIVRRENSQWIVELKDVEPDTLSTSISEKTTEKIENQTKNTETQEQTSAPSSLFNDRHMQKIQGDGGSFSIAIHQLVGIVVYDPLIQQGLSDVWLRFYVVDESRFGQFTKADIDEQLVDHIVLKKLLSENTEKFQEVTRNWVRLRDKLKNLRARKTWCYTCKRELDSYHYPWCMKCFWIKCNCGSCGCDYMPTEAN